MRLGVKWDIFGFVTFSILKDRSNPLAVLCISNYHEASHFFISYELSIFPLVEILSEMQVSTLLVPLEYLKKGLWACHVSEGFRLI